MYTALVSKFPEIAERETRTVRIQSDSEFDLPAGNYTFVELYCTDPGCDCRRVMFHVVDEFDPNKEFAKIGWGWECRKHYAQWMRTDDEKMIDELVGPNIESMQRQSAIAPELLRVCKKVLLKDELYVERIKRHYSMFRKKIGQKKSVTKVSRGSNITPKKKKR